jgi:hypothetical protein
MRLRAVVVPLLLAGLVACGGDGGDSGSGSDSDSAASFRRSFEDAEVYPVFANADLATGKNRFIIGLNDANDAPVGAPDVDVAVDFYNLEESATDPVSSTEMDFVWSIKPLVGVYAGDVSFDSAGEWGAEVDISGGGFDETLKGTFRVKTDSSTPGIGEKVPPSDNPTSDDVKDLSKISTDKDPDPRFYESTVKEALKAKKPFAVIFATPKFCQTQTCGPMLDIVKGVADDFPDVTFIHIEPYELPADPSNLVGVPAALEWGLPSEPWTFLVDGEGEVAAKFEGALSAQELDAELKKL